MENTEIIKSIVDVIDTNHVSMMDFVKALADSLKPEQIQSILDKLKK